jgi:AraC-like DNA-binding protein/quercetin dioxygenase-like cupin family protein
MSLSRRVTQITRQITAEQEPFLTARSLATTYSSGYLIPPHSHGWHQLLYACAGAMTVFTDKTSWMIPPGRAVYIPAQRKHSIRMWGEVAMRSLYFPASFRAPALEVPECRVIAVTPLLRELILRVVELAALDSRVASEVRLMSVLMDELGSAPIGPLALPLPADSRALAAAMHVLGSPADSLSLETLARQCGVGARTLERLFRAETGMRYGLWRQKARLLESIRLLVESKSVTNAALESGYSSVSAYIAAFKQTFGCTPRALLSSSAPEMPW